MEPKIRTGVIGAGVFGGHHAGKLAAAPSSALQGVYDPDAGRARSLADRYGCAVFADAPSLIAAVDALTIASPASTHGGLVRAALEAGRHVYVEKPLAETEAEARALAGLARARGLVLQVGHQERTQFAAMGLFSAPPPRRVVAVRAGPFSGRADDVSVTSDLMVHDIDLVLSLMGSDPIHVAARGRKAHTRHWDEIEAELTFIGGATASLHASRMRETRERQMSLAWVHGRLEIDFLARRFDNATPLQLDRDYAGKIPDPLGAWVSAFLAAVRGEGPAPMDPVDAARAVAVVAEIDRCAV
jgi:predicted dehydrogenase